LFFYSKEVFMKAKFVLSALLVLSLACVSSAQLNGNYTIDPSGSGPTNYTTFAAASTALGTGVSGPVTFTVASTTFNEALTFSTVTGASATNTITFIAIGAPAVIQAGATTGMTLNTCKFFIFENLEFNSSGSYCLYSNQSDDNTYKNCKFIGGSQVVYSQGMDRCVFDSCELDGKGTASRLVSPYNANDSDCLFQNCFIHDCSPTGLGVYLNVSGYGIMFWHNTVIVNTSNNAVHLGGCCAWSRANSFRNNIVINMGTGVAIKYGHRSGVLEFNDADYNCYYAPNGNACELEGGTTFTKGTLAQWLTYFAANPSLVPAGGGTTWDQNSLEMNPALTSMTAPYDIHLTAGSPCVDAGTTTYIAGTWISYNPSYVVIDDFEGDLRPATNVDIGADESMITILTGSGTGKIGTTVNLFLDAGTGDASLPYQLASSFGAGPIPIDTRLLGLTYDSLLVISVNGLLPTIFQNYSGFLDASGKATAAINIPNIAALDQIRIYTAFVTIKAGEPSSIKTISNTFVFTIVQ
jgi:hypothetical protein